MREDNGINQNIDNNWDQTALHNTQKVLSEAGGATSSLAANSSPKSENGSLTDVVNLLMNMLEHEEVKP